MQIVELLLAVLAIYATFWASYVLALPILAGLQPSVSDTSATLVSEVFPTLAVIVPAHNMENVIGRCVESLEACGYPPENLEIHVVADHCSDATEEHAREAGASVLIREVGRRGKTYTLAWAIETLTGRGSDPDLYVIVDATVRVDPGFLHALAKRATWGEAIIVGHAVVDPENQQWFAQCVGLSLVHRNLQNRSRERLRLSSLIEGRGMAYSRRYVMRHRWSLALPDVAESDPHPTEDWRHGVRAVEEGWRVSYAAGARVFTPLRESLGAATQQGVRWERGRMANAATHGLRLLAVAIKQRNRLMFMAALDAVQPPVAILGGLCLAVAVVAIMTSGARVSLALSSVPLILILLYAFAVLEHGRRDGIKLATFLWAPVYIAWRCMSFVLSFGFFGRLKAAGPDRKHGGESS